VKRTENLKQELPFRGCLASQKGASCRALAI
jgi:hypothetical protein